MHLTLDESIYYEYTLTAGNLTGVGDLNSKMESSIPRSRLIALRSTVSSDLVMGTVAKLLILSLNLLV